MTKYHDEHIFMYPISHSPNLEKHSITVRFAKGSMGFITNDTNSSTVPYIFFSTGLVVELEHLKIKTRLPNEKFPSVKVECEI
jgi:hypothetical protein